MLTPNPDSPDAPVKSQHESGSATRDADCEGWLLRTIVGTHPTRSNVGLRYGGSAPASGDVTPTREFVPAAPRTMADVGLDDCQLEELILKSLLNRGTASGAAIAKQVRLPFGIVDEFMRGLKSAEFVAYRKSSGMLGDFSYELTPKGVALAKRYSTASTYYGSAPVPFSDYVDAVGAQSIANEYLTPEDLRRALDELHLCDDMINQLGQAMCAGQAIFLYGEPGNGKTSIAERLTAAFGSAVWVPRAISVDGEIIRLFDPAVHEEIGEGELTYSEDVDQRWVRIRRPTIVIGGELTMANLEITVNRSVGVLEAPIQLKSNMGTLVVDDFGRQRVRPDELLNRWIVPLEKHCDYLNLPSGKKVEVPFNQLTVFSTNIDPKDIVDEAFLRRIPYKIRVSDPTEEQFCRVFTHFSKTLGLSCTESALAYLIEEHYRKKQRPLRFCHPRDLLLQIHNLCRFNRLEPNVTNEFLDSAVANYFLDL